MVLENISVKKNTPSNFGCVFILSGITFCGYLVGSKLFTFGNFLRVLGPYQSVLVSTWFINYSTRANILP